MRGATEHNGKALLAAASDWQCGRHAAVAAWRPRPAPAFDDGKHPPLPPRW